MKHEQKKICVGTCVVFYYFAIDYVFEKEIIYMLFACVDHHLKYCEWHEKRYRALIGIMGLIKFNW